MNYNAGYRGPPIMPIDPLQYAFVDIEINIKTIYINSKALIIT